MNGLFLERPVGAEGIQQVQDKLCGRIGGLVEKRLKVDLGTPIGPVGNRPHEQKGHVVDRAGLTDRRPFHFYTISFQGGADLGPGGRILNERVPGADPARPGRAIGERHVLGAVNQRRGGRKKPQISERNLASGKIQKLDVEVVLYTVLRHDDVPDVEIIVQGPGCSRAHDRIGGVPLNEELRTEGRVDLSDP